MSRNMFANHPFMLGFDHLERVIERAAKNASDGFPPYNIEQLGENAYRITLAVAGFAEDELSVNLEERQLMVKGAQRDTDEERIFLHRGIAGRQFQRAFLLAHGVEVQGADLRDGLLHIDLIRKEPERIVETIQIRSS